MVFRSKAAGSSGYRADIDGLRAIAVLAVVFFHAHVPGFGGGYVGVDIFFVISGFLITGIVKREIERGSFSFWSFYDRRIRRIFPALFAVILVLLAIGVPGFMPWELTDFGRSLLAVSGFASNLYFRSSAHDLSGYFKQTAERQWLLHTWSLSLEEQFYLFLPIVLLGLHRFAKRFTVKLLLALFIASLALSVRGVIHSPIATFYLLPARAWELLLGSLLAYDLVPQPGTVRVRVVLSVAGLAVIAYAVVFFTNATRFPGPAALLPCGGAALLLYSGGHQASWIGRALSWLPLVFIGAISYSLYLWHWPVYLGVGYFFASSALTQWQTTIAILLSFVLAFLSFEYIETPLRKSRDSPGAARRVVLVGVAASFAMAGVGYALVANGGLPQRFSSAQTRSIARIGGTPAGKLDGCGNYHPAPKNYDDAKFCAFGESPQKQSMLVWGDSHGEQLYPLLDRMREAGELRDLSAIYAIAEGCILSEQIQISDADYRCDEFMRYTLMRASKPDVDTVFIVFSLWWISERDGRTCLAHDGHCTRSLTGAEAWQIVSKEMESHIRELEAEGKHVVLTVPFPVYREPVPALMTRNIIVARLHVPPLHPTDIVAPAALDDVRALAARTGASLYDPRAALCPAGVCLYEANGVSLYADESHLSANQLEILHAGLRSALAPQESSLYQH